MVSPLQRAHGVAVGDGLQLAGYVGAGRALAQPAGERAVAGEQPGQRDAEPGECPPDEQAVMARQQSMPGDGASGHGVSQRCSRGGMAAAAAVSGAMSGTSAPGLWRTWAVMSTSRRVLPVHCSSRAGSA